VDGMGAGEELARLVLWSAVDGLAHDVTMRRHWYVEKIQNADIC
jgi:hypothetical protein